MSTEQLTGQATVARADVPFALTVLSGPDAGKSVLVEKAAVVGTDPAATLPLTDSAVSRNHIQIELSEVGATVTDLGSTNGTLLANLKTQRFLVRDEASFRIGRSVLKLYRTRKDEVSFEQFGSVRSANEAMRRVFAALRQSARGTATVLLQGETGTGKEVLGNAMHQVSSRAAGPWIVIDCGRLAPDVMEAELFGSIKGSFTGSTADRQGLLVQADRGMLFLDAVDEMPLELQTRLLRFVVDKQVRALGSNTSKSVDVRIIASTTRNLKAMVESGSFRADLYYRLAGVVIDVPSLRSRPEDLEMLFRSFLTDAGHGDFYPSPELTAHLYSHAWPGNVRELNNFVSRVVSGSAELKSNEERGAEQQYRDAKNALVDAFTKQYFSELYARCKGNVSEVARVAGLARPWVHQVLKRFQIHEVDD
jgi:two-component system, NtrC family, response regulator GlrR